MTLRSYCWKCILGFRPARDDAFVFLKLAFCSTVTSQFSPFPVPDVPNLCAYHVNNSLELLPNTTAILMDMTVTSYYVPSHQILKKAHTLSPTCRRRL